MISINVIDPDRLHCAGIWGGKGQGKTFQTELIFRAMGVEPVIMSAGELESEKAGQESLEPYIPMCAIICPAVRVLLTLLFFSCNVNFIPNF